MIDRFLRRLTVRGRIIGGFMIMVALLLLTIPLTVTNHYFLIGRLKQVAEVETRANRLLLQASTYIESSRTDLLRYTQDYLPSVQESLNDITHAGLLLTEAQKITVPDQQANTAAVLSALGDYQTLISEVQVARNKGNSQEATQLVYQASRTGLEIGQRIDQIVQESERHVEETNRAIYNDAEGRLRLLIAIYGILLVVALVSAALIERSITRPVAELRKGAETLRQGRLDAAIPTVGSDELSLLANTFNQMGAQLFQSYAELEQRVDNRTREVVRRSAYLEASAQVSHAASSILETDQLIYQAVELIREHFDLYYVGLFLVDDANEWAVLKAGTGAAGQAMLARGHKIKLGEGMVGWSVVNAQARIALEAGKDAARLATAELPDTRSEAALPLRSRDKTIGALTVQSAQPDAFDQTAIAVLQTMADQVAIALDNTRLFAESKKALEAERLAFGEASRQAWAQILHSHHMDYLCTLRGMSPSTGPWKPAMVQASQTGQTIQDGHLNVAIPIKVRGETVGVIEFRKPTNVGEWTTEEITLTEALTDQLGVALESARLYQDTQRRAARERILREVTARIRSSTDPETVLRSLLREVGTILNRPTFVRLGSPEEGNPPASHNPAPAGKEQMTKRETS